MTVLIAFQSNAFQNNAFQGGFVKPDAGDFIDYIFQFSDQGSFLRDSALQPYVSQGVALLVYNPVETLNSPALVGNSLVFSPQQANSTVALSGFWGMVTVQGFPAPLSLINHSKLQIANDRTLMFSRLPSVIFSKIDISHINMVINSFGVYVADGLQFVSSSGFLLLEDKVSALLLEDGTSDILLQ